MCYFFLVSNVLLLFWYLERELIQKCIFERNTEIKDVNNCKQEGQAGPRLVPGRERTKLDVNAVWVFLGQNWAPELVRRVPECQAQMIHKINFVNQNILRRRSAWREPLSWSNLFEI